MAHRPQGRTPLQIGGGMLISTTLRRSLQRLLRVLFARYAPLFAHSCKQFLTHRQATFALSSAESWKEKIGDIDLIELYTNTDRMLRLDFKWVDETLDTLQSYVQIFTSVLAPADQAQLDPR